MKIDEAIRALEYCLQFGYVPQLGNRDVAIKLGIEALRWISVSRKGTYPIWCKPLPGETEK